MIKGQLVVITGGTGGAGNSIPVYGSKKLSNGDWAYDLDGKTQLLWPNGKQLIRVNPDLIAPEDPVSSFFTFDGGWNVANILAARVWVYDPETGKGEDLAPGKETWVKNKYLVPVSQTDPEPQPEPQPEPDGWQEIDEKWEGGKHYIRFV